jgi:hypothetical protein
MINTPIRFVDGEAEREILRERYREKLIGLTVRERMCWELGFDLHLGVFL